MGRAHAGFRAEAHRRRRVSCILLCRRKIQHFDGTVASEVRRISPLEVQANRFALVSRLADDLAHEIKNPLHALVINLELIKRRAQGGDTATVLQRAEFVGAEVTRVNTMLDQLLQLLRPMRQTDPVRDLDGALEEFIPLLAQQARLARVELVYHGIGAPEPVPFRRDALKLVLLNLVAHGLDALGASGGRLELVATPVDGGIEIVVADAPGGAAAAAPARGAPSGDRDHDLELGMDVVRSLVEEVGGAFSIEPVHGGGTRRVVRLGRSTVA